MGSRCRGNTRPPRNAPARRRGHRSKRRQQACGRPRSVSFRPLPGVSGDVVAPFCESEIRLDPRADRSDDGGSGFTSHNPVTSSTCNRSASARCAPVSFLSLLLLALVIPARGADPAEAKPASSTEEAVRLNPFEVNADSDKSYGALNANSITAFNTALDHLPVTADIFDQAFMDDVGAINVESAIQAYDAGSQFGGLNVSNAAQNQPGDHLANGSLRLRGSPIGGMQINGLLIAGSVGNPGATSFGSTSNFYLERLEVINGPQALLFAGGGPGGVINLVSKRARIGEPDAGTFTYRIDNYGSKYATFDVGASRGPFA